MNAAVYRIPDEPRPSRQERLIVDPVWPFFAQMLVGAWMGVPWFLFNGAVMGSPTLRREILLATASLLGSAAMAFAFAYAYGRGWFGQLDPRYAGVAIAVVKLGCAYALYFMQQRPYELWRHFGGRPANGMAPLFLAMVIVKPNLAPLFGKGLLALVLG